MIDDNYEPDASEIHKANEQHLENYSKWLRAKKLSPKTISKHLSNVDFYINYYLTYYDVQDVKAGCYAIDGFAEGSRNNLDCRAGFCREDFLSNVGLLGSHKVARLCGKRRSDGTKRMPAARRA